jgi:hypothetical protein
MYPPASCKRVHCVQMQMQAVQQNTCRYINLASTPGAVWLKKCNVNGNGNGLRSITGGNKFE